MKLVIKSILLKLGLFHSLKKKKKDFFNYFDDLNKEKEKKRNKEAKLNNFRSEYIQFEKLSLNTVKRFELDFEGVFPCLDDNTDLTYYDRHYVLHPAWAARIIKKTNPEYHYDISSALQFGAVLSAFIKIKFFDYRPAQLNISNFESSHADLLKLPFEDNSISSLSCMHTIEHVGLGRYGDKLNYDGDIEAINELQRVVSVNGDLLIVVPVAGISRIQFNAHRVFTPKQIIDYFKKMKLIEFCLIPDSPIDGDLVINPGEDLISKQVYGCGCFWFKKT